LRITLHAAGSADADEVWDRYVHTARWPSWSPQISRVESSQPRISTGSTGKVFGPLGVHVAFVVDAVDEPARSWSWHVRLGLIRIRLRHVVNADGSTELQLRGPLPVVLAYTPLAQLALNRLVLA
jgi:hypothetical protein